MRNTAKQNGTRTHHRGWRCSIDEQNVAHGVQNNIVAREVQNDNVARELQHGDAHEVQNGNVNEMCQTEMLVNSAHVVL